MQMPKNTDIPGDVDAPESLDVLSKLLTLSVDTHRGFQKMVEQAEVEFRPTAELFSGLHSRHVARLGTMLREMGAQPDEDGSFMGSVNVGIVSLRAVFDAIDMEVMDRVRSGEENVFAAFDRAIAISLPPGYREALTQMKTELTELLDKTREIG